jgi:hypothetical protein
LVSAAYRGCKSEVSGRKLQGTVFAVRYKNSESG